MKDQYVGDVGDYSKYALLLYLLSCGLHIGINWYRTENDGSSHGSHLSYLSDPSVPDPALRDWMLDLVSNGQRSLTAVEALPCFDSVQYEHTWVPHTAAARKSWHQDCLTHLSGCDMVFLDPDNGAGFGSAVRTHKEKYAFYEEILDWYKQGCDVLCYVQRGRRPAQEWLEKQHELSNYCSGRTISLSCHRGSPHALVFLVHPECYESCRRLLDSFLAGPWGTGKRPWFTEDPLPPEKPGV